MRRNGPFSNILIIKPGAIGDLLQMTPVIRAVKSDNPRARISLLVGSEETASLFQRNPHLTEVMIFGKDARHASPMSFFRLWERIRKERYDLILNFQRSNVKTWLLASAAFPCRLLVYHKSRKPGCHAVNNYLATLAPLGITTTHLDLELECGPEDEAFADRLLDETPVTNRPLIALNPGASHPVNRWDIDRFAELADLLSERISARVIIIGGKTDIRLEDEIVRKTKVEPLRATCKTTLLQLAALLKKCRLLVTGDTGPLHLATAVGTRVVSLFGAADPSRTGPVGAGHVVIQARGVPCVPCRSRACANRVYLECMNNISVQEVFDAITFVLQQPNDYDINHRRSSRERVR